VIPNGLLIHFNVESNEALLDRFETDLDWIEQDLPIHELFVRDWWTNLDSAYIGMGPEARGFRFIRIEAAERRFGKLKAALESVVP
jgi:hypothetical protein